MYECVQIVSQLIGMKSTKKRALNKRIHDFKYIRIHSIGNLCVYCGEWAEVLDHVPPISAAHLYKAGHIKVPACKSCNKFLSGAIILSIKDRKKYIIEKILKKRKKSLRIPNWEEEELCEIKGFVNGYIKKGLIKQRQLQIRLKILTSDETFILPESI